MQQNQEEPASAGDAPAGSFRELWTVALPLILSAGSLTVMNVIDRIYLTWYSTDALAAAMPAGILHWTVMSVAIGTATYVNTFVAQYEGAGRKDRVAATLWQGIYLSLAAGVLLLAIVPFSETLFSWIGHAPALQILEAKYFAILCAGSAPMVLDAVLSCFYSGRGHSKVVFWVNTLGVVLNIGLDYCLIFGFGPIPSLGIAGAAIATVISKVITVLAYTAVMLWSPATQSYRIWHNRRFEPELFRRLIRYGLPSGLQFLADVAGFSMFIFLIGAIGTTELAATSLAFNLNSLAFLPMMGLGTAVMTLVGKRIGEGRPELALRTTWTAFGMSAAYMSLFIVVYLLIPDLILVPYAAYSEAADFAQLREIVVVLLRFVAVYSFFDAMAIVFGSAVRGAGDTRFAFLLTTIACWLVMVLPVAIGYHWFGGSLTFSWGACTLYIVVLGTGFLMRFRTGLWTKMRVIEAEESFHPGASSASGTVPDWHAGRLEELTGAVRDVEAIVEHRANDPTDQERPGTPSEVLGPDCAT